MSLTWNTDWMPERRRTERIPTVSDKMSCPSCDAYLSSVLRAYNDFAPCPNCGLPAEVTTQILETRKRHLDDERTDLLAKEIAARGIAEAELAQVRQELVMLKVAVEELGEKLDKITRPFVEKVREEPWYR